MSPETKQSWPAQSPDGGGNSQAATQDRYTYRGMAGNPVEDSDQHNGATTYEPVTDKPRLPSLDLEAPAEPVFSPDSWLAAESPSLADHPLLRGLLLELPPKGTIPPPGWLDRWFEATRSILELLYVNDRNR